MFSLKLRKYIDCPSRRVRPVVAVLCPFVRLVVRPVVVLVRAVVVRSLPVRPIVSPRVPLSPSFVLR